MLTLAASKIFNRLNQQKTYSCVGKSAAESNVHIFKKYSYFFGSIKEALRIYVVIELAKLFEKDQKSRNQSLNINYILNRIEKNIDKYGNTISYQDIKRIKKRLLDNKKKIKNIKDYRDEYIAHDDISKKEYSISNRDISTLLTIAKDIINLLYLKFEFLSNSYENFKEEPVNNLNQLMKDLMSYDREFRRKLKEKWNLKK